MEKTTWSANSRILVLIIAFVLLLIIGSVTVLKARFGASYISSEDLVRKQYPDNSTIGATENTNLLKQPPQVWVDANELSLDEIKLKLAGQLTQEEYSAGLDFSKSLGYIENDVIEIYKQYSREVLVEMGKNGDLAAVIALAKVAVSEGDFDSTLKFWIQAVVLNGAAQATALGNYYTPQSTTDDPEARRDLCEGFAWYQVAYWLNDPYAAPAAEDYLNSNYLSLKKTVDVFAQERLIFLVFLIKLVNRRD